MLTEQRKKMNRTCNNQVDVSKDFISLRKTILGSNCLGLEAPFMFFFWGGGLYESRHLNEILNEHYLFTECCCTRLSPIEKYKTHIFVAVKQTLCLLTSRGSISTAPRIVPNLNITIKSLWWKQINCLNVAEGLRVWRSSEVTFHTYPYQDVETLFCSYMLADMMISQTRENALDGIGQEKFLVCFKTIRWKRVNCNCAMLNCWKYPFYFVRNG